MVMAFKASKLIKLAEAEVGYLEKKTNSNLDSKTGNSGYNNWTKYARDLNAAGYYNGNKNGYAWCDVFVDWLFLQLCDGDAKKAQWLICQTGDYGASCTYSMQYYKNAGRFYKTPKVGDQIFFGSSTSASHTGIVYKVDGSKVYTIEGNTSSAAGVVANGGGVFKKSYSLNYTRIAGYGRPRYDEETTKTEPIPKEAKTVNIELKVLKKGSKNNQVKTLQRILYSMKYNLGSNPMDGDFGKKTDAAVRHFQRTNKLEDDGIVGEKTWAKLLKG
jgi:hypothetical protein